MKKVILLGILILSLILVETAFCNQPKEKWEDISYGIDEIDLKTVAVDPQDPDVIYAGSTKSVFKSPDNGKSWRKLYMVRGTLTAVNIISVDLENSDSVYAGTQNGLFKSSDGGISWNKVFEGVTPQEKDIRYMIIDSTDVRKIYIGTGSGIFITSDAGKTWNKLTGKMSNQNINFIVQDFVTPDIIYCAVSTGVFKSIDHGLTWERIFTATAQTLESERDETSEDINSDETTTSSNKTPKCIAIDAKDNDKIYIGTNCGVFISYDTGKNWQKLTNSGLLNNKVTSLISSDDGSLYAATKNGIFKISRADHHWDELYVGLLSKDTRYLAYNKRNNSILAVTKKGIYTTYLNSNTNSNPENYLPTKDVEIRKLLAKFESEPSIQEIQEAAIRYAEVHKEKIDEWRKSARRKALLPSLSVGVDHDIKSTSEIYTSSTHSYWTTGPKDTSTNWDVTVSWNLGDLIWNDDQTSIDVRSRLMVQLRDDVLDEVTRFYFERRRLQIEVLTNPPTEINKKIEKTLRLQELTAGIDALTGGYLSRRIRQVNT